MESASSEWIPLRSSFFSKIDRVFGGYCMGGLRAKSDEGEESINGGVELHIESGFDEQLEESLQY